MDVKPHLVTLIVTMLFIALALAGSFQFGVYLL